MIFSIQGARPLHTKRSRVLTTSSLHWHNLSINNRRNIISCGSIRLFTNVGVFRLRRITRHRSMALQGKQCQQQNKTRYSSKLMNEHGHQPVAENDQKHMEGQGATRKYSSTWSRAGYEPARHHVLALQASISSSHRVPRTAT